MAHYDEIRRKSVVNSCLSPRKANKINGLLVQGLHCGKLITLSKRVLILCVCVLTFYDRQTLAAITFPNFLRYRVTTIWLSIWYSYPIGSVDCYNPHWYSDWFSLVQ